MPPPGKRISLALLKKTRSGYFKAEHFADNVIPTNREVANSIIFFKEKHTTRESISTVSTLLYEQVKLKLNSAHQTRLQLMSSISLGILYHLMHYSFNEYRCRTFLANPASRNGKYREKNVAKHMKYCMDKKKLLPVMNDMND